MGKQKVTDTLTQSHTPSAGLFFFFVTGVNWLGICTVGGSRWTIFEYTFG
jgi:hypothetical protein